MSSNKNGISFFHKLIIFLGSTYLWILIFIDLPFVIMFLEPELLQDTFIKSFLFQIIVSIFLIVLLLIDWFRKTEILKNCYIDTAETIDEIIIPFQKARTRKLILRLTLGLNFNEKKFVRHFYFVRKLLIESNLKYQVVVSKNQPDNFILLNSLPKIVRKKIEKR